MLRAGKVLARTNHWTPLRTGRPRARAAERVLQPVQPLDWSCRSSSLVRAWAAEGVVPVLPRRNWER